MTHRLAEPAPPAQGLLADLNATATRLGAELKESQAHTLVAYVQLLQRWNSTYNLTAVRDPRQMLVQHLADCLAVVEPVRRHAAGRPLRLLDVGSGPGLPGLVIATALPAVDVTCIDTVGKKVAFVRQAAAELRLPNLHVEHARVERLRAPPFDVIASRAFASLTNFVDLTRALLGPTGVWMAMKGKRPDDEMAALPADIDAFHVEQIAVPGLNAERCLVWMRSRR